MTPDAADPTGTSGEGIAAFAADVGPTEAGPVVAVGGRTQWDVGGPLDPAAGARTVRAPAGIVAVEAADMTVRVRAGTTVADLAAALAEVGQAVALPSLPGATVGGVLAVGQSGLRRLGWGAVRDTVLEVRYVSAAGTVVKAGGPTVKNVSGFDLCRLLVGSLGTLGLLAEVVLRTRPLPATERWLAGPADPFALARRLHRPAAVLWDGSTTWVLLDGHPADVDEQARLTGLDDTDGPPALPPHRWSLRPTALRSLAGAGAPAGDARRLPADGGTAAADPRLPGGAIKPGAFVAEVGVGIVHADVPPPTRPLDPAVATLHAAIKRQFDPTGRLAPGRDPRAAARGGVA
ncbi:MAG TPA: FAD-binding protein [Acidimicrobiales bacterium]|nr:FAD-binding protein [Acidimicrobiales bacterium]